MTYGEKLNLDVKKEFRQLEPLVSEVLWKHWDPLDLNENPEARGEYDAYVPRVIGAIMRGANALEIASLLTEISEVMMGISESEAAQRAANVLIDARK